MNEKNYGYTLIEMITTLVIASAFSIGIYYIFISSSNNINREEILFESANKYKAKWGADKVIIK